MYGALKAFATQHWGQGKLVLAVAGRRTWVVTPKEDVDLGEIDPRSELRVMEGADGKVTIDVIAPVTS
jgi:hypothetical protein